MSVTESTARDRKSMPRPRWFTVITSSCIATAMALGLTVMAAPPTAASGSDPRKCFSYEHNNPYKTAGVTLYRAYLALEWCGVGDKVTEFRVIRCESGDAIALFVKIPVPPEPRGDYQQREPLNLKSLRVYGDMWGHATVSYERDFKLKGGRLNTHYELRLYPDGGLTGSIG